MTAGTPRWLLMLVLLLGEAGVLAGGFMPSPHSGGDNAGYLALGHSIVEGGGYSDLYLPDEPPHTKYPPVFPLALAAMMVLGARSWTAFKLLSTGAILLSTALVFLWVDSRRGPWVATAIAVLSGLSSAWLYAGNWILSDPLFLLFTLGALVGLERGDSGGVHSERWMVGGIVLVVLAAFTRSAGLPLVIAAVSWLVLRKRRRSAAWLSTIWGIVAMAWWMRGRASGGAYTSELRLLDPYRPDLGPAGVGDFLARAWENALGYGGVHIPAGLIGQDSALVGALGAVLVVLAAVGWWIRIRQRIGVAELFGPLYVGILLLWPVVWSGDRFALPLFPLFLYWAWTAIAEGLGARSPRIGLAVGIGAFCLIAVPEAQSWRVRVEGARECRSAVRFAGPFACGGQAFTRFVQLAEVAGEKLPVGAITVARKPRFFFLASGRPAISLPLTEDPDAYLDQVEKAGATYIVFDALDGTSSRTTGAVLTRYPERFCVLASRGNSAQDAAFLLRILGAAGTGGEYGRYRCDVRGGCRGLSGGHRVVGGGGPTGPLFYDDPHTRGRAGVIE